MLTSTYQTYPTETEREAQITGRMVLNAFTQYAGGSSELWRLVVHAKTMHVPLADDPTLLTYAQTPPGITAVWTDFRQRPIRGAVNQLASIESLECRVIVTLHGRWASS